MKHLLFVGIFFLACAASAQLQPKQVFIEGTFSYSRIPFRQGFFSGVEHNRFATINMLAGVMVTPKTAAVAGFNYAHFTTYNPNFLEYQSFDISSFSIGIRQFVPLSEQLYFFGQGIVGYGRQITDGFGATGFLANSPPSSVFIQIAPGLMFFPKPRFAVTAQMGLLSYKFSSFGSGSVLEFNGGSLRLGLLYRFGRAK